MRHYETLFVINPDLTEEESQAAIDKFQAILTDREAVMVRVDPWGRRRLAYQVKRYNKGFYVLFEYGAPGAAVDELERIFKIDDAVIRFLTVKLDDQFDAEAAMANAGARKPAEDEEDEEGDTASEEDED